MQGKIEKALSLRISKTGLALNRTESTMSLLSDDAGSSIASIVPSENVGINKSRSSNTFELMHNSLSSEFEEATADDVSDSEFEEGGTYMPPLPVFIVTDPPPVEEEEEPPSVTSM